MHNQNKNIVSVQNQRILNETLNETFIRSMVSALKIEDNPYSQSEIQSNQISIFLKEGLYM